MARAADDLGRSLVKLDAVAARLMPGSITPRWGWARSALPRVRTAGQAEQAARRAMTTLKVTTPNTDAALLAQPPPISVLVALPSNAAGAEEYGALAWT